MKAGPLLLEVRARLVALADEHRAAKMQAYMKSTMPYHGVPMPLVRAEARAQFEGLRFETFEALREAVRGLWFGATHREERYAALALLRASSNQRFITAEALPLDEELITTGAWWDLVDEVATHQLHPLLVGDRRAAVKALRRWSRSGELWLRRAAIIAQVQAGAATDVEVLFELIEPAVEENAFFLRKAIGWALRALGPWHPDAVVSWLDQHADRASGLTVREARKGLDPKRRRS